VTSVEVRSATYAYCLLSYATPHRRGVRFWVGGEPSRCSPRRAPFGPFRVAFCTSDAKG